MSNEIRYDAFVNLLSGFGTDKDRTTQNRTREMRELDQVELEIQYRDNHYAARVIDLLPNDSVRRGFVTTTTESDDGASPFEDDFKRLGLINALNQCDKWARLYGGAAVILGIDDGQEESMPVNMARVRGIDWLYVVDRYSLTHGPLEGDPAAPWGFGRPSSYTVNLNDSGAFLGGSEQLSNGTKIHASRMIRMYGVDLPPSLRSEEDYWGDSILQRVNQSMANLNMVERAIGNIVHVFNQPIFKKSGLGKIVKSNDGKKQLAEIFSAMNLAQSMLGMMIVDKDEDFERRSTNVSGLDAMYDRIAQSFGAAFGGPLTLVYGTSPSGFGTDDAAGNRNWQNNVRANQAEKYVPAILYVATLLIQANNMAGAPTTEPRPLEEPTEEQVAQTLKTVSEAAAILIDRGVLRPSEARTSIKTGYAHVIQITEDEVVGFDPDNEPPMPETEPAQLEDNAASTPADPSERVRGSKKNPKGSASGERGGIKISATQEKALQNKIEAHNEKHNAASKKATMGALKAVYRRGAGAFSTSHRPGMTRSGWAMARVNAYLYLLRNGKPEKSSYTSDFDLLPASHPKSTKKKDDEGHTPPNGVQAAAARGLKLREEFGRGGTATGIARARDLSNGKSVSAETIQRMVNFFNRHQKNKNTPPEEGNGKIAWLLWGGDPGRRWAEKVLRQIEKDKG